MQLGGAGGTILNPLCRSCRLTRVIPNLGIEGNKQGNKAAWFRLEAAKRRLVYSLLHLGVPLESKAEQPERGLAFEFLANVPGAPNVVTGHAGGLITINIAEADDAEREKRRGGCTSPTCPSSAISQP